MTSLSVTGSGVRDAQLQLYYAMLHEKLMAADALFDASWGRESSRLSERMQWGDTILHGSGEPAFVDPLFQDVLERLVLLQPQALLRLLCATSLLSHREVLRRCINGGTIRQLQAVVGTPVLASILRSRSAPTVEIGNPLLLVPALVSEGFSNIAGSYSGQRACVLHCLRLALPTELSVGPATLSASEFDRLLRESHAWFPESAWLFG